MKLSKTVFHFTKVLVCIFFALQLTGQHSIRGVVLGSFDKIPIQGASIVVPNTDLRVFTDMYGKFELRVEQMPVEIVVSFIDVEKSIKLTQVVSVVDVGNILVEERNIGCIFGVIEITKEVKKLQNFSILKNAALLRNPTANIAEPLNTLPGVQMYSATYGTNKLTIRGIGNRTQFGTSKIKAYWNDIPISDTRLQLDFDDLDITMVDDVAISRGPSNVEVGSALGGSIQLESKAPRRTYTSRGLTVGSFGLVRNTSVINVVNKAKTGAVKFGYTSMRSSGYRDNNAYEQDNLTIVGNHTFGKRSQIYLDYLLARSPSEGEIPSSLSLSDFKTVPSAAAANWKAVNGREQGSGGIYGASVQYSSLSNWHHKLTLASINRPHFEVRPFNTQEQKKSRLLARYVATKEELFGKSLNWVSGIETQMGRETLETTLDDVYIAYAKDKARLSMAFTSFQASRGNFKLDLGISASIGSHTTTFHDVGPANVDPTQDPSEFPLATTDYEFDNVSPSLRLGYNGKYNHLLYISIAQGFSPPNDDERFDSEGNVNTNIRPEKGWTFEIGTKNFNRALKYDIVAFVMPVTDLLVPRRITEELTIGINAGSTMHAGVEALVSREYKLGSSVNGITTVGYTYNHFRFDDFVIDGVNYAGNALTGSAQNGLVLTSNLDYSNFTLGLRYQYQDDIPLNDANTVFSESYHVINTSLAWQKELSRGIVLSLLGGINNLFGASYSAMHVINARGFGGAEPRYYYPGLPRNSFVNCTLNVNVEALRKG